MSAPMYRYKLIYHDADAGLWHEKVVTAANAGAALAPLIVQVNIDDVTVKELGPAPKAVYAEGGA